MLLPLQFWTKWRIGFKLDTNIMTLTHTSVPHFWGPTVCNLHYGPGIDSVSNRNKYQEYFLGVKAASA